jgi:DNA-binding transcriptional ArsR family regulator
MRQQAMTQTPVDQLFAALGDATRREIFRMVSEGPQSVSVLARALDVTLTAVTQHLRVLESCGLLRTRKVGRVRICEMDHKGLDVLAVWLTFNRHLWERRFDALDAMLLEDAQPASRPG